MSGVSPQSSCASRAAPCAASSCSSVPELPAAAAKSGVSPALFRASTAAPAASSTAAMGASAVRCRAVAPTESLASNCTRESTVSISDHVHIQTKVYQQGRFSQASYHMKQSSEQIVWNEREFTTTQQHEGRLTSR